LRAPIVNGCGIGAIATIERNLRLVADYELVAMAKALKVSPVRLLGRA
jgi:hypothetical protein